MKVKGRITLDKHLTLEQLDSLVEEVRGLAYPLPPDLANNFLYFELDTDDYAPGNHPAQDLSVVTARALAEEAATLGVKFEEAAHLVAKAVGITSVWDEIQDIVRTYGGVGEVTVVE